MDIKEHIVIPAEPGKEESPGSRVESPLSEHPQCEPWKLAVIFHRVHIAMQEQERYFPTGRIPIQKLFLFVLLDLEIDFNIFTLFISYNQEYFKTENLVVSLVSTGFNHLRSYFQLTNNTLQVESKDQKAKKVNLKKYKYKFSKSIQEGVVVYDGISATVNRVPKTQPTLLFKTTTKLSYKIFEFSNLKKKQIRWISQHCCDKEIVLTRLEFREKVGVGIICRVAALNKTLKVKVGAKDNKIKTESEGKVGGSHMDKNSHSLCDVEFPDDLTADNNSQLVPFVVIHVLMMKKKINIKYLANRIHVPEEKILNILADYDSMFSIDPEVTVKPADINFINTFLCMIQEQNQECNKLLTANDDSIEENDILLISSPNVALKVYLHCVKILNINGMLVQNHPRAFIKFNLNSVVYSVSAPSIPLKGSYQVSFDLKMYIQPEISSDKKTVIKTLRVKVTSFKPNKSKKSKAKKSKDKKKSTKSLAKKSKNDGISAEVKRNITDKVLNEDVSDDVSETYEDAEPFLADLRGDIVTLSDFDSERE